ncbi:MAG: ankyrin repeat domain-containing protein [Pseudomonadota bacterium]
MAKRTKRRMPLDEILASCSDSLFPESLGAAPVTVHSRDVEGDTPLHVMLWRGDTYAVRQLIEAGADVNAAGDMSETPLHIALKKQNLAAATALIEAGADLKHRSEFEETPADIANALGGDFKRLVAGRR